MSNHFDVLGLPRTFALADADIEGHYLARSRETHPDFHQLAPSSEQRASLELTALLNEAYNTLRDPFKRAEYLLTLEGGPSAAEAREMSPLFLEEMLEFAHGNRGAARGRRSGCPGCSGKATPGAARAAHNGDRGKVLGIRTTSIERGETASHSRRGTPTPQHGTLHPGSAA